MKLDSAVKPLSDAFGARFAVISYLPTYGAVLFVLILVWAGAPGKLRFGNAWKTAADLGLGEVLLLAVAITVAGAVTQPLQLSLVRLAEGYWPRWLRRWDELQRKRHRERRKALAEAAAEPDHPEDLDQVGRNRIGQAKATLSARYPVEDAVRPTAFGNVLAAAEAHAGARFGWDAVVAWPRLYPVLGEQTRAIVDDRRDTLDLSVRLCAVGLVTGLVTVVLLAGSGWWVFLALVPIAIGLLAYRGAIQAALAYGEAIDAAFDLHRFDLLVTLHQPLPADPAAEVKQAKELSTSWRQGAPAASPYHHQGPK